MKDTPESTPDTRYNGWKNRPTWSISLWIMNDEPRYRLWQAYKACLGQFTAKTARSTAQAILGGKTPDGVRIYNPAIDWEELARVWNTHE